MKLSQKALKWLSNGTEKERMVFRKEVSLATAHAEDLTRMVNGLRTQNVYVFKEKVKR